MPLHQQLIPFLNKASIQRNISGTPKVLTNRKNKKEEVTMKSCFTNRAFKTNILQSGTVIVMLAALISLLGCSSGIEQGNSLNRSDLTSDKSFSFKDRGSDWRVDFDGNEISALYQDGVKIPDKEIDQHKEMIYEKLEGIRSDFKDINGKVHRFHFDMDKFGDDMKKFKDDFDKDKYLHFRLEFDEDEFEKNMEKLEESLKDLKDKKIELYFDSESFKENMKELEKNLKDLPIPPNPPDVDIDIHLDMDAFKEGMKNFKESFKDFDIKIDSSDFDMSELRNNMKELKRNMKGLKIEIHGLKGEMKKLNAFLDDLKSELVVDGYINSIDQEFNLEMDKDYTKIDGVNVKTEDHNKYKELYKKHFEKEIDGKIKINTD